MREIRDAAHDSAHGLAIGSDLLWKRKLSTKKGAERVHWRDQAQAAQHGRLVQDGSGWENGTDVTYKLVKPAFEVRVVEEVEQEKQPQ